MVFLSGQAATLTIEPYLYHPNTHRSVMDAYTPPSVTEYGDANDLTRGNFHGESFDGSVFIIFPLKEDNPPNDPS